MAKDKIKEMAELCKKDHKGGVSSGGAVYGFGFIGAVIYYLQHAGSFSEIIVGLVKAIFWPALMVYKLIEVLGV